MSTLFPLPPATGRKHVGLPLFELAPLPRNADHVRHPAHESDYTLAALHELLRTEGITLQQAPYHPKAAHFLSVRQGVFEGTWPLFSYTAHDEHWCDGEDDFCLCPKDVVYWTCPCCGTKLQEEWKLDEDWYSYCDRQRMEYSEEGSPCDAEFVARELGTLKWAVFLVPNEHRPTPNR